jgi:hypothetical protein
MTLRAGMRMMIAGLALAGGTSAAPAGDFVEFKSPSNNIYCAFYDADGGPEVRCDIRSFTPTSGKRPADCEQEWGDSFAIGANGKRGSIVCHGDTVISPNARTLGYGKTFASGGISCTSATSGMTCKNRKGHGFSLSKKRQRVF